MHARSSLADGYATESGAITVHVMVTIACTWLMYSSRFGLVDDMQRNKSGIVGAGNVDIMFILGYRVRAHMCTAHCAHVTCPCDMPM